MTVRAFLCRLLGHRWRLIESNSLELEMSAFVFGRRVELTARCRRCREVRVIVKDYGP